MFSRQSLISPLKSSEGRIEAAEQAEKRRDQPDAAEDGDGLQGLDIILGSERAGKNSRDSNHMRPPKPASEPEQALQGLDQLAADTYELAHIVAAGL